MAPVGAALQVSLFRPSRYQRWQGETLRARLDTTSSLPAGQRVGVVIDADGHSGTLSVEDLADRLAAERGVAEVSVVERACSDSVRRWARAYELNRLVVGGPYYRWMTEASTGVLEGVGAQGIVVRVVDLDGLCGGVHRSEEAAARALLLLLAAVARVRSSDALTPASVDEELRAVLDRDDMGLSPCVPVLTCPAGLASLRAIGRFGIDYLPGAIPVEVPCHLNMDRRPPARALDLGAAAVLAMGCVPRCVRGCQVSEQQAGSPNWQSSSGSVGADRPLATVTAFGLSGLVEALDACLSRIS